MCVCLSLLQFPMKPHRRPLMPHTFPFYLRLRSLMPSTREGFFKAISSFSDVQYTTLCFCFEVYNIAHN